MNGMKNVAVVTRTKDRPNFLKRAIKSVADQTYGEYVHVIVNDGGDSAVVEEVVAQFNQSVKDKIIVFHRSEPSGAPDTIFNESIDRVDSNFFALHDDDDSWHAEFLERTVEYLENNPDDGAVVVRCDKVVESITDNVISEKRRSIWMEDVRAINLYRQCIDNQMTPIATLFRRSAYEKVGKFDSALPVIGDWEFGVRLLLQCDVGFIDPGYSLASYHHRDVKQGAEGSTSFTGNDKHRYYTNKVMNAYLRKELSEGKLGVGHIMSQLKYDQGQLGRMAKSILPRFATDKLKSRFSK